MKTFPATQDPGTTQGRRPWEARSPRDRLWEFNHGREVVELARGHRGGGAGGGFATLPPTMSFLAQPWVCWPPGADTGPGWLLGILLRPLRPASRRPAGGASSPSPAWAMHYPRKIEDLMEAISTRGSHSIQALEGGQNSAPWLLYPS